MEGEGKCIQKLQIDFRWILNLLVFFNPKRQHFNEEKLHKKSIQNPPEIHPEIHTDIHPEIHPSEIHSKSARNPTVHPR